MILAVLIVIAVVMTVLFFPLRIIIHKVGNSGSVGLIIIGVINLIIGAAGLGFSVYLAAVVCAEGVTTDTLLGAGLIFTIIYYALAFVWLSMIGTQRELYDVEKWKDPSKEHRHFNRVVKTNGFWSSLISSLIFGLIIAVIICVIANAVGAVWYSYIVTSIPALIIFLFLLWWLITAIKNA